MQTFWLLFGSATELSAPYEFTSCREWSHESVDVTPVWCICEVFGQLEFCAGDVSAEIPFLEVYPRDADGVRPYIQIRLKLQGD